MFTAPILALGLALSAAPQLAAAPENAALALAVADLSNLDPVSRKFTRYVWIPGSAHEDYQTTSFTINSHSVGTLVYKPLQITAGPTLLARIDLRKYAGRSAKDLQRLVDTWEFLRFDPKFSLLVTKDTLRFLSIPPPKVKVTTTERVMVDIKPYVGKDGKTYSKEWQTKTVVKEVPFADSGLDVARFPSDHLDLALYQQAVDLTGSEAPVVSHRYFQQRAMGTLKYDGDKDALLWKTLYGGLYYEMSGVPKAGAKGTDLDALLESLGIGNVAAGITAEQVFNERRSDRRALVNRSGVTGKERLVEFYPTLMGLEHFSIVSITNDFRNRDIDVGTSFKMNLLRINSKAKPVHEVLWSRANGLMGGSLYNGEKKLAQSVPEDVAKDSTIPNPHTDELHGFQSCLVCHGKDRGWRVVKNEAGLYLPDVIFRDADEEDRVLGLYSTDVEAKILPNARDAFAAAVLRATGPWKDSRDQLNVVELVTARLDKTIRGYLYDLVDAKQALIELGFSPAADPVAQIVELLPPVPSLVDGGIFKEDPRLATLKKGGFLNRWEWDLVYSFAATRAHATARVIGGKK